MIIKRKNPIQEVCMWKMGVDLHKKKLEEIRKQRLQRMYFNQVVMSRFVGECQ